MLLFHHVHGLTEGVRRFAEELELAGHTVHLPDLYEGGVFKGFEQAVAHADAEGFDTIIDRSSPKADGMHADPLFVEEGDLEAARALASSAADAELFLYPGDAHLFADPSLSSYDAEAAALLTARVLGFLEGL